MRDIGGRVICGRRVRQGLVYRSSGLNNNATTYYSCSETLKMYKDGVLEKKFGEEGRKMKDHWAITTRHTVPSIPHGQQPGVLSAQACQLEVLGRSMGESSLLGWMTRGPESDLTL